MIYFIINLKRYKVFRYFIYLLIIFFLVIFYLLITNEFVPSETIPPFNQKGINDFIAYYTSGVIGKTNIENLYSILTQYNYQIKFIQEYDAEFLPFLYPPFIAIAFIPFTLMPVETAFNIWVIVNILLLTAIMLFILKYYKSYSWWIRISIIFLLLFIRPVTSNFGFGQIALPLVLVIIFSWFLFKNKLFFLSGLILSLMVIKLQYMPLLLLVLIFQRNLKMLSGFITGLACLFLFSFINTGMSGTVSYVAFLWEVNSWNDQFGRLVTGQFNLQAIIASVFGIETNITSFIYIALSLVIIILIIYIWYKNINSYKTNMKWAALVIAVLLISPHTNIQDLTFLIPVFVILLPRNVSKYKEVPRSIRVFLVSLFPILFFFGSFDLLSRLILISYLLLFLSVLIYESLIKQDQLLKHKYKIN